MKTDIQQSTDDLSGGVPTTGNNVAILEPCETQAKSYFKLIHDLYDIQRTLKVMDRWDGYNNITLQSTIIAFDIMNTYLSDEDRYPGIPSVGLADTMRHISKNLQNEYKERPTMDLEIHVSLEIDELINDIVIPNMIQDIANCQCGKGPNSSSN